MDSPKRPKFLESLAEVLAQKSEIIAAGVDFVPARERSKIKLRADILIDLSKAITQAQKTHDKKTLTWKKEKDWVKKK